MPMEQIVAMETIPDTVGKTWKELGRGSPTAIPGLGIEMEPGVLYETQYVAQDPITTGISQITANIGAAIATLYGVRTEYIVVEGNVLRHGYMVPIEAAIRIKEVGLAIPVIGAVIGAIGLTGLLVLIGALLIIIGLWAAGIDPIELVTKLIPGMMITVVGGVVTGALPGAAKIAGLIPVGLGMYMMLQAMGMIPTEPPEPDTCLQNTNQLDCEAAGCHWWSDNTCHSTIEGEDLAEVSTINII